MLNLDVFPIGVYLFSAPIPIPVNRITVDSKLLI